LDDGRDQQTEVIAIADVRTPDLFASTSVSSRPYAFFATA